MSHTKIQSGSVRGWVGVGVGVGWKTHNVPSVVKYWLSGGCGDHVSSPYLWAPALIQNNITLLPLIARGMFCGAKYTHHTFTSIIKHKITTTANKHPGKKSFIDKNIKNPTGIKLCISHKTATSQGPPLKSYCPNKSSYVNCVKDSQLSAWRRATCDIQLLMIVQRRCTGNGWKGINRSHH